MALSWRHRLTVCLTLSNLKIHSKIFVIPAVAIACITYLAFVFSDVIVEQKTHLHAFSSTELKKSEALTKLYSKFTTGHIAIFSLLAKAGTGGDEGELGALRTMLRGLGVADLERQPPRMQGAIDEAWIEARINQRNAARAAGDWTTSDRIRDELGAVGIALHDGPDGTTWSRIVK